MTDTEKIALIKEIFKGREDAYGRYNETTEKGKCVKEPVTDEVIKAHLTGKKRIGRYPLSPHILDGSGTLWVAADIDDDDLGLAIQFCEALEHLEIPCYIERSKSKGYHVWVFFTEPIEAKWARGLMKYAMDLLEKDTDYRIKEVFPKQNSIRQNDGSYGFGNYIYLPLFGESVKEGRTVFLDSNNGYKPHPEQWAFLQSIEKISPQRLGEVMEANLIDFVVDAAPEIEPEEQADFEPEDQSGDGEPKGSEDTTEEYSDMLPCVPKMMQGVSEGCRDVVAFTLAKHFRVEKKLPQEATLAIIRTWNQKNTPPLTDKELQTKVKSAYKGKGGGGYTGFSCSDTLIQQFCEKDSCPVFQKKKNPYFIGKTFIPKRLADELMEENHFIYSGELLHVYRNGVFVPDAELFVKQQCRKKLGDAARVNHINEVIAHISDMTFVETDELNTRTNLINLKNGMYDWIEKKLLPHNPEYLSTIRIPVEYNPQATCPTVDYFFESTLPSDCLQIADELFGYALIPDTLFEKAFMFPGTGANGKSTFLNLLEGFVGIDNVSKVPLQDFDENRFKRAELFGKLVNLFADLDARALKSSSYFKTIVTGDAIDAERKHRDPFFFRPFARLAYSANQLPYSYDKTFAYYRRWVIIPFPNQFVGKNDDKSLKHKLTKPDELSGLLNRALTGLNRLFENQDFSDSETVKDALEDYKKQNDTVAAFVADCCEFGEGFEIERTKVYDAYTTFCQNEGFEAVSRIACYNRMRANMQVGEKIKDGVNYFTGIKCKVES
jgi:P4 family phage/plasmid primase-like protien